MTIKIIISGEKKIDKDNTLEGYNTNTKQRKHTSSLSFKFIPLWSQIRQRAKNRVKGSFLSGLKFVLREVIGPLCEPQRK